jgi:TolB-like protein/DNA-binding SARP family transcriptional activator/Flp pilus assembly protein TadD
MVALFWPEHDTAHARGALRQALRFLRRALGPGVLNGSSEEDVGFEPDALECDATAFERACADGRAADALKFYRGDFLEGFFVSGGAPELERWIESERARLRQLAARAATQVAEQAERAGDAAAAVQAARQGVALDPDDESAFARLIELLDRSGDRAGALSAFEAFRRRVREEYDATPSPETEARIRSIRERQTPFLNSPKAERLAPTVPAMGGPPRRGMGGIAFVALGALALGGWFIMSRARPGPPAEPLATSVAVLYFENLSRDSLDAYLIDGLSEEITSRLGLVSRLHVKSRNAVRRFRSDTMVDPTAVGRLLGVRYLVEGSVRRTGRQVHVAVRLVNAADGFRVWGADFNQGTDDLLALQVRIADSVGTSIAGQLLPAERAALAAHPTHSLTAYDHYLRGNYHLAQRTARSVTLAIQEYDAAVRLDSGFTMALARGAYGRALFLSWGWTDAQAPGKLLATGLAAADRALAQDSTSSDAWMARAYLLTIQHPRTFEGAADAFQRAFALDSGNAEASHQFGWVLAQLGQDSAAAAADLRALAIDPERAVTLAQLGEVCMAAHRLEEARRWLDSALAVDPAADYARSDRAFVRIWLGDATGARDDALRLNDQALLAILDMRAGDSAQARSRMREALHDVGRSDQVTVAAAWNVSMALVALGEPTTALDLLDRVQPRGPSLWYLLRMPGFDAVATDRRYRHLIEETRPPTRALSLR